MAKPLRKRPGGREDYKDGPSRTSKSRPSSPPRRPWPRRRCARAWCPCSGDGPTRRSRRGRDPARGRSRRFARSTTRSSGTRRPGAACSPPDQNRWTRSAPPSACRKRTAAPCAPSEILDRRDRRRARRGGGSQPGDAPPLRSRHNLRRSVLHNTVALHHGNERPAARGPHFLSDAVNYSAPAPIAMRAVATAALGPPLVKP